MIDSTERKIKVLRDEVINKIAAGEVVERPASIVKELVENALDAGATRIKIDLEEGGKKSLVITDNGKGITKEDLPLSVVRHATSKIGSLEDLFSVGSMGFRGEALASISSVSHFSLVSKKKGEKKAYKLSFKEGAGTPEIENWAHPEGTTISVTDLFYNVPVRLKFLRSAQTEFSHCLEMIQALSLANPHQTFILTHNGKEKFLASSETSSEKKINSFIGEKTLRTRVAYLFGKEVSDKLLYVTSSSDYLKMEALIAPPGLDKAISKAMFTFVNGRWVKDKVLRYGILRGYHSHLLKGRYPHAFCYLTLSPELVDVNVHPSKTELRFQYADEVQGQMARTIRDALRKEAWASSQTENHLSVSSKGPASFSFEPRSQPSSSLSFSSSARPRSSFALNPEPIASRKPVFSSPVSSFASSTSLESIPSRPDFLAESTPPKEEKLSWVNWEEAQYVGTVAKCYLIFEVKEKLLFVDQHAFHERILYEKLCLDKKLLLTAENLLIPETLSLEASTVASLLEKKEALEMLSFSFEKISEEEIEVLRIPSLLNNRNLSEVFCELSEKEKDSCTMDEVHHLLLATIACHSAVRAGEVLSLDKIERLKEEAKEVDFSANCPHGRRVFKWFSGNEMKAWFDRT